MNVHEDEDADSTQSLLVNISDTIERTTASTSQRISSIYHDFKEFIHKGPLVEVAVGIVVGSRFSHITESFVQDILLPPLSLFPNAGALRDFYFILRPGVKGPPYTSLDEAKLDGAVTENIGVFMSTIIDFLITAFALFWVIKSYSNIKSMWTDEQKSVSNENVQRTKQCVWCFETIHQKAIKCKFCCSLQDESSLLIDYKNDM
jgi:large conductance mechanosensitive channel